MDEWQKLRLDRAKQQPICVTSVECMGESFIFNVQGQSDEYEVEINQHVTLWPPSCSCADHQWRRGEVLCKHVLLCLKLMGVSERDLEDCCWEGPEQRELYAILCNGPGCVGGCLAPSSKNTKCKASQ